MFLQKLISVRVGGVNLNHFRRFTCWSCGNQLQQLITNLFCPQCKSLQEPDKNRNYFHVLGVTETYDLDENVLAKQYKQLQKYLHPDKFANRDKKELEISEKHSSLVNEAYNTLLQPMSRGIYMLKLRGKEISENTEIDMEFLSEIMEKNEEVEDAETEEDILKLNEENKRAMKSLQELVSQAFFAGDINLVTKLLSKMKYYASIDNQIQSIIRSKGIIR